MAGRGVGRHQDGIAQLLQDLSARINRTVALVFDDENRLALPAGRRCRALFEDDRVLQARGADRA